MPRRLETSARARRSGPALAAAALLLAAPVAVGANGDHGPSVGPPTRFERFALSACSPCVREVHPVATLPLAPLKLSPFPRGAASMASRPAEIAVDVLRAHQLGRPGWQSLALRVTLSVAAGSGGEVYRLAVGLLDADEVPALAAAVADMARAAAGPPPSTAASVDMDFHGGSLRVGVLRFAGESVGYVQAGDLTILMQREVWEVPTSVYLPVTELPGLAAALGQAAARIQALRAN